MKKSIVVLFLIFLRFLMSGTPAEIYSSDDGVITFRSEAAQELISATSHNLHGLINSTNRTFAFRIAIRSFTGFNNGLQREHFNENYLESDQFPEATFRGKII